MKNFTKFHIYRGKYKYKAKTKLTDESKKRLLHCFNSLSVLQAVNSISGYLIIENIQLYGKNTPVHTEDHPLMLKIILKIKRKENKDIYP